MAYFGTVVYCNAGDQTATGYYAVAKRGGGAAVGQVVRQATTPAVGNERCFVCVVAGSTGGGADASWTLTRGAKTIDGGVTWQECTGAPAVNGDPVSTPDWAAVKGKNVSLGQVIKRNSGASYQICSTTGNANNIAEPAFSNTAGSTVTDGTVVWTSLGSPGGFFKGGAPHARIANAGADPWFVVNGTIYVGDNHAEFRSGGGISFAGASGGDNIGKLVCHDHAGNYPPAEADLRTTATVSCTQGIGWYAGGAFYVYGVTFKAGIGSSSSWHIEISPQGGNNRQNWTCFDHCSFWLMSTAERTYVLIGMNVYEVLVLNNTTVRFSNPLQAIVPRQSRFTWRNTPALFAPGSVLPSILIWTAGGADTHFDVLFEACDMSQFSNKLYSNLYWWIGTIVLKDCKLNPAMTCDTEQLGYVGNFVEFQRSDSGAATYRSDRYVCEGSDITETAIVRAGGAVDLAGQTQSRKLVTFPAALWLRPLLAKPFTIWISTPGEITLAVYGLAAALPANDDIWIEVEHLADPTSTLGTITTTTKAAVLASGVAVEADSSGWSNAPAGWVPFKLSATVLPAHAGYIHVRVMVGKPSATFYVDPHVVLG